MTSRSKVTPCRLLSSSLSPDSVSHSVSLVAVALAVAGVLRAAGGPLVPPQSHRPVGEHRDAFGDAPAGLRREQCEADTLGHFKKVFFDTAEVLGNTEESQTVWAEDSCHSLNKCIPSDNEHATSLKLNSTELMWNQETIPPPHTLKMNGAKFKSTPILAL